MADKKPSEPKPPLNPMVEGMGVGLGSESSEKLAGLHRRYEMRAARSYLPSFSMEPNANNEPQIAEGVGAASGSSGANAEGELVGGDPKKQRRQRTTQGKSFLHGADRTVRFYKPTEAELDRLGELSRDEASAWGRMSFCLGLLVNVILGLLFAVGLSSGTKVAGVVVGVLSAAGALTFWLDAKRKGRDGKSLLEKVKTDHNFANI